MKPTWVLAPLQTHSRLVALRVACSIVRPNRRGKGTAAHRRSGTSSDGNLLPRGNEVNDDTGRRQFGDGGACAVKCRQQTVDVARHELVALSFTQANV